MDRYQEIREYVNDYIEDINNMNIIENKMICLFSLIDSFCQNYSNYDSTTNNKSFCEFILKYADKEKYNYLNDMDPVTLIYDFKKEKIRFKELSNANTYTNSSQEIKAILNNNNIEQIPEKIKKSHTYIKLIYNFRSKVTHECALIGGTRFKTENEYDNILYEDHTSYWKLIFPFTYLKNLFINCIDNYLNEQEKNGKDPFYNNENRKSFYAYYD